MIWDYSARVALCEAVAHVRKYGQGNIVQSGASLKSSPLVWRQVEEYLQNNYAAPDRPLPTQHAMKQEWHRMLVLLRALVQVEQILLGSGWPPKSHDETFREYFDRVSEDGKLSAKTSSYFIHNPCQFYFESSGICRGRAPVLPTRGRHCSGRQDCAAGVPPSRVQGIARDGRVRNTW
jgi:hypothetical protein